MDKKILFVDDEPPILRILSRLAKAQGYSPFTTSDGIEAVDWVQREKIRVCFTDLRMPEIDGFQLCAMIKKVDPGAFVFALSAYVGSREPEEFEAAGFDGYFTKPFNLEEIFDACQQAFEMLEREARA